ncbi:phage distal tail protein [Bifidobacterium biavatii]|uniref:3-hydroxy-3-methylglutaryl CoA synthase n=1 Tax=Bifidobacterium biavatii DSM 23969 TaxID=1437608 RepID=A0A086ZU09_9BIFI|nr:3-hydroxy-3-methylglutaryl CoA synthase [Bifidobacterium biavatii]KFI50009.1 3-hydroxy-3-methylglutaryl CoA synthase [Bifidobacterium biavatii DSM 23969]
MILSQRRMTMPTVDGLAINGMPVEKMMLAVDETGVSVGEATPATSYQQMAGLSGMIDLTLEDDTGAAYLSNREITIGLYTLGDEDDIVAAKIRLAALNGRRTTITWRTLPGVYQGRFSVGAWQDIWAGRRLIASKVTVKLDADPCLYGPVRTVKLAKGVNNVYVKGNRPCWPTMSLTPDGSKTVSVKDAYGRELSVTAISGTLSGSIAISSDPLDRWIRLNGQLRAPTLDSDYFPLRPGLNKITVAGASGTISHTPLTLI